MNYLAPTRPASDNSNAVATTAWVTAHTSSGSIIPSNAVSDAIVVISTTVMTSGSPNLSVAGGSFVIGDVGKAIVVNGAGPNTYSNDIYPIPLTSTIKTVTDSTHIILNDNAQTSISGSQQVTYGTNSLSLVQAQLDVSSIFFPNGNFLIVGDLTVGSNRVVQVQPNANVYISGHATSINQTNVSYQINGSWNCLQVADGSTIWNAPNERAGIEFGSNTATPVAGFHVYGTGKVTGPWIAGTPNFNQGINYQILRKGIGIFNGANATVEDIEVSGFDGEAVYFLAASTAANGIWFRNLYVHDSRFNGPNFNVPSISNDGLFIVDNRISNTFNGIEASAGTIVRNRINLPAFAGIMWGFGSGIGPILVQDNVVMNAVGVSYWLKFAVGTPSPKAIVTGNYSLNSNSSAFVVANTGDLIFSNNTADGWGLATPAGGSFPANQYAYDLQNITSGIFGTNYYDNAGGFSTAVDSLSSVVMQFTTPRVAGTTGQIAISQTNAAPINSTAIYPATTAAGQVLASAAANTIAGTSTPTLGASGTLGSIAFGNATSGFITLQPVTGALGATILQMPATSGIIAITAGASIPSVVQGDLLYGTAPNVLSTLPKNTTASRYLSNTGTTNNPSWAQIDLPTGVTGLLALANGGTNANLTASNGGIPYSTSSAIAILSGIATASFPLLSGSTAAPTWATIQYPASATSGGVAYFSSATAMASSAALGAKAVVVGGGAGVAPATLASLGTSGQALVSAGAGVLPAFASVTTAVKITAFTATGTYTPVANLVSAVITCVGSGGGSGGVVGNSSFTFGSGGGGGGATNISYKTAAQIAAAGVITVTIAAGGTAGASGANSGGNGGTTTVIGATGPVTLCAALGGGGGQFVQNSVNTGLGGTGGATGGGGAVGDVQIHGSDGQTGIFAPNASISAAYGGYGGAAGLGYGGSVGGAAANNSSSAGNAGYIYGGGAGGAAAAGTTAANVAGAAGAAGYVTIVEYYTTP